MPIISNLQSRLTRAANTALALGMFPRSLDFRYPKVSGLTLATAEVEPFTMNGAMPLPTAYQGSMKSQGMSSFVVQVPAQLWKNYASIGRPDFELDQTRTLMNAAQALGVRLSQLPEYIFAQKLLTANSSTSATTTYNNTTYTQTIDGVSFFNTGHTLNPSGTQSNIIGGQLSSTTTTGLDTYDTAQQAQAMIRDLEQAIAQFSGFTDDKGVQIYPNLDPAKDLVVMVPPNLYAVAKLAFGTPGAILGGSPGSLGSTGSTSSIGSMLVRDIINFGLLNGCQDVTSQVPGATVSPTYATQYYIFHVNDPMIKPFYHMLWRPVNSGETFPLGSNPEAEADAAIAAAREAGLGEVSKDVALQYAYYEVDTNFNAVGNNAQASVVETESFFMSGRSRQNFVYGGWWTGILVMPNGYTS